MAAPGKKKQDDLRKLMKERRENVKHKEKVDSPFAKYNNAGQLFCIICNIQVKGNNLWVSHIAGKIHKENALKKKKTAPENIKKDVTKDLLAGQKHAADQQIENAKRMKSDEPAKKKAVVSASGSAALLEGYSSSSEDEIEDNLEPSSTTDGNESAEQNVLPKDFFDDPSSSTALPIKEVPSENKSSSVASTTNGETLPEGFFDDPVLDAKARHVEYKDPMEEEWEKFQKTIAEETNVSKTIMEEDLEESTLERDIMNIDEQILQWERVKNLQSLADEVKSKAPSKNDDEDNSDNTDDELAEDDLLDWRSKGVKKL
ncbi:zinc finger protein 830-like [Uloborus diversus]|uniref:zinc finger protein 830-like n=1 Tax=Uloborus diversus TaxID=327109 RepID=UPI00240A870E|nr:zinc finger protein 830-like [Uloborus diversus]